MSTPSVGTIGQGQFFSSAAAAEAAKIVLSARPGGLSEDMLLHLITLDDSPYVPLGRQVYSGMEATNAQRIRGGLRKTKGMHREVVDGVVRWRYTGRLVAGPAVVVEDEADAPLAARERRRCIGCRAFLRALNGDDYCSPCEESRAADARRRREAREQKPPEAKPEVVLPKPKKRKMTKDELAEDLVRWAREHGRPPGAEEWRRSSRGTGYANYTTYRYHFGTWINALRAAGFESSRVENMRRRRQDVRNRVMAKLPGTVAQVTHALGRSDPRNVRKILTLLEKQGFVYRDRDDALTIWFRVEHQEEAA